MGYSNFLAEDKKLVTYRPRLNKITGSVTATVLLQQIIFHADNVGNRPFYKFRNPCSHKLYREGDSWTEELDFSPAEFDTARSKIATRVMKGDSKTAAMRGETANHLVIYWTDASRATWYLLNVDLLNRMLEKLYADSRNSNYQENEESPNSVIQESENTRKLENLELPLSETTTETTIEDTEKTNSAFPENSVPVVEAIIEQTETHPGPCDLARITEEKQAEIGNYAVPARAGGSDGAAEAALLAIYDGLGSEPPRPHTATWKDELEIVGQVLRGRGMTEPALAEEAGELFGKANRETLHFANLHLSSFPGAFGVVVGKVMKQSQASDILERRGRDVEVMQASLAALDHRRAARPPPPEDDEVGKQVKLLLEPHMHVLTFRRYVEPTGFTCEDGILRVSAPDAEMRDWLRRTEQIIRRALAGIENGPQQIVFKVMEHDH